MSPLMDLPADIICLVISHVDDQHTLAVLCRVSRALQIWAEPCLWRRPIINASHAGNLCKFLDVILLGTTESSSTSSAEAGTEPANTDRLTRRVRELRIVGSDNTWRGRMTLPRARLLMRALMSSDTAQATATAADVASGLAAPLTAAERRVVRAELSQCNVDEHVMLALLRLGDSSPTRLAEREPDLGCYNSWLDYMLRDIPPIRRQLGAAAALRLASAFPASATAKMPAADALLEPLHLALPFQPSQSTALPARLHYQQGLTRLSIRNSDTPYWHLDIWLMALPGLEYFDYSIAGQRRRTYLRELSYVNAGIAGTLARVANTLTTLVLAISMMPSSASHAGQSVNATPDSAPEYCRRGSNAECGVAAEDVYISGALAQPIHGCSLRSFCRLVHLAVPWQLLVGQRQTPRTQDPDNGGAELASRLADVMPPKLRRLRCDVSRFGGSTVGEWRPADVARYLAAYVTARAASVSHGTDASASAAGDEDNGAEESQPLEHLSLLGASKRNGWRRDTYAVIGNACAAAGTKFRLEVGYDTDYY